MVILCILGPAVWNRAAWLDSSCCWMLTLTLIWIKSDDGMQQQEDSRPNAPHYAIIYRFSVFRPEVIFNSNPKYFVANRRPSSFTGASLIRISYDCARCIMRFYHLLINALIEPFWTPCGSHGFCLTHDTHFMGMRSWSTTVISSVYKREEDRIDLK